MKCEEGLQIGLTTVEKIADKERQHPRHYQEYDDEHVGQRRREIAGELAAKDREDVAHRYLRRGDRRRFRRGGRDLAKYVIEPAPFDLQTRDRPGAVAREIGDVGDDRSAAARS